MNANTREGELSPVSRTALWTAASRARESRRPDRLFDDPFAAELAGGHGVVLMTKHDTPVGDNPYLPIRTRWFDDVICETVRGSRRQVIMLAAGLDTRAYRVAWPDGTTVFEVDRAEVLDYKQRLLDARKAEPRCVRRAVAADLADDWPKALCAGGYDPRAPSVWVIEGLLVYLTEQSARAVLTGAAETAGNGSSLLVDITGTSLLESPYLREYLERIAEDGTPWQFGTDEPARLLAECGWQTERIVEPGEDAANFGRWPFPQAPADTPGIPRSYLVVGRRG